MIPSILSSQLRRGLKDYIDTTFQITTSLFKDVVTNLVNEPNKVFREPYVSVKLPFRKGNGEKEWFEGINLKFPPYVHQEKAFERLRANAPKSTLVATGTGSGKTECFLYPILEYCYKHRGEQGIKAVLIYPMNALATDQARRLAELINSNENLRGNVRAGMFVGDKEDNPSRVMSKEKIITDREMLREYPPDILLTNYKMLDYLLIRPDDAVLWRNNNSQSLKFIVVDEIHTFDGAQGTDLAALLRRLKSRLETPKEGYLCCVGTSATMGSKSQGKALVEYANNIFGEVFDEESIVTEDRLKPYEYLEGFNTEYMYYNVDDRFSGKTKFTTKNQIKYAITGITNYSIKPLKLSFITGLIISLLSLIYIIITVFQVLIFGKDVPGYASLLVVSLFMGGLQLIFIGIVGAYLGKNYIETKNRPIYLEKESKGFDEIL